MEKSLNKEKMKVYIKESPRSVLDSPPLYYIFEKSKSAHIKLKRFTINRGTGIHTWNNEMSPYYWFEGLTGKDWFRGGFYPSPLMLPYTDVDGCQQGFCDGIDVYLLREIRKEEPKHIEEYDYPLKNVRRPQIPGLQMEKTNIW